MNKGVFIGLGGSGVKSVARLKYKILTRQYSQNPQDIGKDFAFLFLDTDNEDINRMNNLYRSALNNNDLIEDNEIVKLGDTNPFQSYWQSKGNPVKDDQQKRLLEWMDPKAANALRDQPLVHGAGGIRVEGRTAVWANYNIVIKKIDKALDIIQDMSEQEDYQQRRPGFWVFSGTCGGTGSSALLDILYLFDRKFRSSYSTLGEPYLRVVLFMPQGFVELFDQNTQQSKYLPNAYALFKEIDMFLEDRYGQPEVQENNFRHFSAVPVQWDQGSPWPLFQYGILCDIHTENEFHLSLDELYESVAEMIYYVHLGQVHGAMLSHFDNITHDLIHQNYGNWKAFISMGYRALRSAFSDFLLSYIQARFEYEMFKYGLLGKGMDGEISDKTEQQKLVQNALHGLILQPVGLSNLPTVESNLETYLKEQIYPQFQFTDHAFRNKKGKYDSDWVKDINRIDNFKQQAYDLATALVQAIKNDFDSNDSPFSRDIIRKKIETSLKIHFESLMLIYGLLFAQEFLRRLDLHSENFTNDLQQKIANDLQTVQQLEAEIDHLKQMCQHKGEKFFTNFYQKLKEYIHLQFELQLNRERLEILKWFSAGETGLIDEYERILGRLKGKLETVTDMYEKKYNRDLVKQFADTQNNPTTTFIPRIHEYVYVDGWKKDHLFARLYEGEIPVQQPDGIPERHADDPRREKSGLHKILYSLFTEPQITGIDPSPYFDYKQNSIRFFSKILDGSWTEDQLIGEMSKLIDRYVQTNFTAQNTQTGKEIHRDIRDVYNTYVADNDSERRRVKEEFSEEGTQVFCPLNFATGGKPAPKFYFVSPIQALAKELGYNRNDPNHQFLEDNQLNAVYKIKFYVGVATTNYGPYQYYKNAYRKLKGKNPDRFYPHIHRLLNQAETLQKALGMLSKTSKTADQRFFLKLLFYAKIGELLNQDKFEVQKKLVFDTTPGIGLNTPVFTPVKIEVHGDQFILKLIKDNNIVIQRRKIRIVEDNLQLEYRGENDLISCFESIRTSFNDYNNRMNRFESEFESRLKDSWSDVFTKAAAALQKEFDTFYNDTQDEFYSDLHKMVEEVKNEFINSIPR